MDVVHRLPTIPPTVDNRAVAVSQLKLRGDVPHDQKQVSDQLCVPVFQIVQRGDLFFRNDKDVSGSLRTDISKRQGEIVFINDLGRDLAIDDLREEGRHG